MGHSAGNGGADLNIQQARWWVLDTWEPVLCCNAFLQCRSHCCWAKHVKLFFRSHLASRRFFVHGGKMAGPVAHDLDCKACRPLDYFTSVSSRLGARQMDFSRSLSQRHHARPRLQSPGATLDLSSEAPEAPSSSVHECWDYYTNHQISQAGTSNPSGLHSPQPPATEAGRTATCHDAS